MAYLTNTQKGNPRFGQQYTQKKVKGGKLNIYPGAGGTGRKRIFVKDRPGAPSAPAAQPPAAPLGAQPVQTPTPFYGDLDAADAEGVKDYEFTMGGLQKKEDRGRQEFGFDTQGNIDPNNPFSRAALLKRSYDQSVKGNTNSYAAQGQLYAGSLQRAQNETRFGFEEGLHGLKTGFDDFIDSIAQGRLQAGRERDRGTSGTAAERVRRATETRPGPSTVPTTPEAPAAVPAAPAAKRPPRPKGGRWSQKPVRFNEKTGQWYFVDKNSKGQTVHIYKGGRTVVVK